MREINQLAVVTETVKDKSQEMIALYIYEIHSAHRWKKSTSSLNLGGHDITTALPGL